MIKTLSANRLRVSRCLLNVVLCGVVATGLQGCIEMAIGTAVVGTMAASDRRTLGAQTEDKAILVKGESRIPSIVGNAGHVNVTSFNRKVLLTGEVKDDQMKAAVEREVGRIEGVQSIVNELEIAGPSSYTARSNDSLITGKVKASFVDTQNLNASSIKVVTERGNVYLLGRVTQREGQLAAEVTRGVGGVQKVIKLFDYISEEELKSLSTQPDAQKTDAPK